MLVTAEHAIQGLVVDGSSIYYADYQGKSVKKVSTSGGDVTTLASDQNLPYAVAVDETSVYWVNAQFGRSVMKLTPK